jgi:hypothetical protein
MQNVTLITAMAERCATEIGNSSCRGVDLATPLQPQHLLWMCSQIQEHADDWNSARLHRWIGFIQAAMLANRMIDLTGLRAMFDAAKNAHGAVDHDCDLVDHLDVDSYFELELGGQG